jgi:AraC family transcriptional regulator
MTPRIETLTEKKLVGKRITMSLSNNKTAALWKSFMINRKEIHNTRGTELYSMQRYPVQYFQAFNPNTEFEKWAAIEVADFNATPAEMETTTLPGGLYAVFLHQGPASTGAQTFQYIFQQWLPLSAYILDERPHFELLDHRYKNEDPGSEEEIWIPIRAK